MLFLYYNTAILTHCVIHILVVDTYFLTFTLKSTFTSHS